jgi:hypothetical protein
MRSFDRDGEAPMRRICLAVMILVAAATSIFAPRSFFGFSAHLPLAP